MFKTIEIYHKLEQSEDHVEFEMGKGVLINDNIAVVFDITGMCLGYVVKDPEHDYYTTRCLNDSIPIESDWETVIEELKSTTVLEFLAKYLVPKTYRHLFRTYKYQVEEQTSF